MVAGLAFDPMYDSDEWVSFTYDLESKTLTGGSYGIEYKKKAWWKVW